ncbi:MAG: hypothetical protein KZQ83_00310 [gamma proteobacterium symbiont of Taylorina sp.]|nr:hypothetical protein [gamma proteobacterium symbiont of Taylorina sp.]
MIRNNYFKIITSFSIAMIIPTTSLATNDYLMMGNGTKANGRAGVGIAIADSAISGADNPAAMVRVGNRFDFGMQVFDPERTSEINGNPGGSRIHRRVPYRWACSYKKFTNLKNWNPGHYNGNNLLVNSIT